MTRAIGGYGSQASNGRGRANCRREVIWFSPHCKPSKQPALFDLGIDKTGKPG
jgi:hypothetical protein